jgi:DNA-binding CsgD family transcriptional regulator
MKDRELRITNAMVLLAQNGDRRAQEEVAECFRGICAHYFGRCRALQIVSTLDDFQQDVAVRWVKNLPRFDPARSTAVTWSCLFVATGLKHALKFHQRSNRALPEGVTMRKGLVGLHLKDRHEGQKEPARLDMSDELTEREESIVHMLARGKTMAQIGRSLGFHKELIRQHKLLLRRKVVDTRTE